MKYLFLFVLVSPLAHANLSSADMDCFLSVADVIFNPPVSSTPMESDFGGTNYVWDGKTIAQKPFFPLNSNKVVWSRDGGKIDLKLKPKNINYLQQHILIQSFSQLMAMPITTNASAIVKALQACKGVSDVKVHRSQKISDLSDQKLKHDPALQKVLAEQPEQKAEANK